MRNSNYVLKWKVADRFPELPGMDEKMKISLVIERKNNSIKYFRWRAIGLNALRDQISPAETEEYPRIFPNFQNCACLEIYLKDIEDDSPHLARKYARIFVHQ